VSAVKVIIGLNVACFIAMVCSSSAKSILVPSTLTLLNWGASSASETIASCQYWRLLTCCFVHAGILHIAINMYVLRDIGREVENAFGWFRFSFVYLISACGGALISIFVHPLLVSAGASGAIFGSFGAMLAVVWKRPENFPKGYLIFHGKVVLFLILYSAIFSFIDKNTDNAAHCGGFIVGFLAGLCALPEPVNHEISSTGKSTNAVARKAGVTVVIKYAGATSLVLLISGLTVFAHNQFSQRPDIVSETYYRKAVELLKENKFSAAMPLLDTTLEKAPSNANALCDRARANLELKHFDAAISDCTEALKDKNVANSAYAIRAAIYQKIGQYRKSVEDLTGLIALDPRDSMAYNNRAWSEEALGQCKEAMDDCNKSLQLKYDSATVYDTRAVDYILLRDFQKAIADLDRAIKLKPEDGAFYYHKMIAKKHAGVPFETDRLKFTDLGYVPEPWEPQ
jgi:rhomboid protease GluP